MTHHTFILFPRPLHSYVALIEKAFAKLYGSYATLGQGGFCDVALAALTGGVGDSIFFSDAATRSSLLDGTLYSRLTSLLARGNILCCASQEGSDDTVLGGVVQGHAYALLDLREVRHPRTGKKVQLAKLANPWYVDVDISVSIQ